MEIAKIIVDQTSGRCLMRQRIPAGLVNATVAVEFNAAIWEGLEKTVVFRGTGSKVAEFDGVTAVIPWEVLEHPGPYLYFGIWGRDPETGLQLPLIEVPIGRIEPATDVNADPGADPTLPIWADLDQRMDDLEENLDQVVAETVKEYLIENPPSGGVEFETDETLTLENGVLSVNTEVINTMTDEEIAALNAHII